MTIEIWMNEIEKEIRDLTIECIGPNVVFETIRTKSSKSGQKLGVRLRYLNREVTVMGLEIKRIRKGIRMIQAVVFLKKDEIEQGSRFTIDKDEVLRSAVDWLMGKSYQEIYEKYQYLMDNSGSRDYIIKEIVKKSSVMKDLLYGKQGFKRGVRKCQIEINHYTLREEVDFYYRGIKIFEAGIKDIERLFLLMEKWLIDRWSTHKIQELFSEVKVRHPDLFNWWWLFGKRKLENLKSWDKIEAYYLDSHKSDPTIQLFIEKLRSNKFDRKTKAERVLGRLIVLKSSSNVFKKRNKVIAFDFNPSQPFLTINTSDGRKVSLDNIEFNERVMDECKFVLK